MESGNNLFLFELGSEEIPSRMIEGASLQLCEDLTTALQELNISFDRVVGYNSPRRLAALVAGLPEKRPDRRETSTGPPKSVAFDADGRPTRAAQGFASKLGVSVEQLELTETERGEYLSYTQLIEGQPVPQALAEILPQVVEGLYWPKAMYWRESRFRFIRPIRWLAALWNDQVVEIELEGVRSGRLSWGHRFLGAPRVELKSAADYRSSLGDAGVLVDPSERRRRIEKGLAEAVPKGWSLVDDPGLLEDVVYLNEYPTVIPGTFDEKYLEIPREVLVTVMRHHQKYFAMADGGGRLAPGFLTVVNTREDPDGRIRRGHERVLKARLEDAAFFWENDRLVPLEQRSVGLEKVVFQEKLGSYADKTRRLRALCRNLSETWPGIDEGQLDQAASFAKVDLTTDMVGELPELQGIMGGLYAREQDHPEAVWKAVYQHYRPSSLDDDIPSSLLGAVLSVADRFDSLAGCFGIGIVPKGSGDPFGLRRQAQGIIKILLELGWEVPAEVTLSGMTAAALKEIPCERPFKEVEGEIIDFIGQRIRFIFEQKGLDHEVINAVMAVGVEHVREGYERAAALAEIRKEADFEALATAFKRIRNILSKQSETLPPVNQDLLQDEAEKTLFRSYRRVGPQVASDMQEKRYLDALRRLASLRQPVDDFFDEVLVMAKDDSLRRNRLRLLEELSRIFLQIGDISEIGQTAKDRN